MKRNYSEYRGVKFPLLQSVESGTVLGKYNYFCAKKTQKEVSINKKKKFAAEILAFLGIVLSLNPKDIFKFIPEKENKKIKSYFSFFILGWLIRSIRYNFKNLKKIDLECFNEKYYYNKIES